MAKKFKRFSDITIGLGFGIVMIMMGYNMSIGTPFSFQGSSSEARADIVDGIQNWLIDTLGASIAGGLLITLGVVIGLFIMWPSRKENPPEELDL